MINIMVEYFEIIMKTITAIWAIEVGVLFYCLFHKRHGRRKKKDDCSVVREQRLTNEDKEIQDELEIIDLDDDDFTFDFI